MTLTQLTIGDRAVVIGFTDPLLAVMFNEYGILEGAIVSLTGLAPLGDPLCITTTETRVSIRRTDAQHVLIKRMDT